MLGGRGGKGGDRGRHCLVGAAEDSVARRGKQCWAKCQRGGPAWACRTQRAMSAVVPCAACRVPQDILASWVVANNLYSDNNVWLIQVRCEVCSQREGRSRHRKGRACRGGPWLCMTARRVACVKGRRWRRTLGSQVPRLYNIYKETGVIENFQQVRFGCCGTVHLTPRRGRRQALGGRFNSRLPMLSPKPWSAPPCQRRCWTTSLSRCSR